MPGSGKPKSCKLERGEPNSNPRLVFGNRVCVCVFVCVCVCVFVCVCAWVLSRSVTTYSLRPMDCSSQGSYVHGIFQARILEEVAISDTKALPNPGVKPTSFVLAGGFFIIVPLGKPLERRVIPPILKIFLYVGYLCKCMAKLILLSSLE